VRIALAGACDGSEVDDLTAADDILSGLPDLADGPFRRLRTQLPVAMHLTGPSSERFTIQPAENDHGAAVQLTAVRDDGRHVTWLVEVWIYPTPPEGWAINVKAEIDLDDLTGYDRCVLNEQQIIRDPASVTDAIRRATELVVGYPRQHLLTSGWQPPDWDDDEPD
jgi:hypothetical protein